MPEHMPENMAEHMPEDMPGRAKISDGDVSQENDLFVSNVVKAMVKKLF